VRARPPAGQPGGREIDGFGSRRPRVLIGVAVTRYVKERSPNTQVVLFTAYDEMSLSLDATEAGVFAFLVKGCSPSLILQALSGAWDEKQRRDQEDSQVAHPPTGTG